ncbi:deaminase [Streptomyces sp. NPDC051569]|uniref:deaminase n=1 Tax=Streptomyces sp. NPDC051569 TaxID=3365661 RepID=UPI0037B6E2C0
MTVDPAQDHAWLARAVELATNCPPSEAAFNVGAIIVGADGEEISRGFSRESDPHVHAEESALAKLAEADPRLTGATLYSSLEPCSERRSRPRTCSQLILHAGIPRVVVAWREPDLFVTGCQGIELLAQAGVEVVEIPALAEAAQAANAHLAI